jgi:hypothetical protein
VENRLKLEQKMRQVDDFEEAYAQAEFEDVFNEVVNKFSQE